MLNRVEHGIRCYDPCLSCSTHAVGQMPLHVQFGRAPRSWMLTIPAKELGFGERLSRPAALGLRDAVRLVRGLRLRLRGRRRAETSA
jgi:hypothetical protein